MLEPTPTGWCTPATGARSTCRSATASAWPNSVSAPRGGGGTRDSCDNALAETVIGLYKTEVTWRRGPWRHAEAVEFATLEWVDWFNNRRLLEPIGEIPPVEFEQAYHRSNEPHAMGA